MFILNIGPAPSTDAAAVVVPSGKKQRGTTTESNVTSDGGTDRFDGTLASGTPSEPPPIIPSNQKKSPPVPDKLFTDLIMSRFKDEADLSDDYKRIIAEELTRDDNLVTDKSPLIIRRRGEKHSASPGSMSELFNVSGLEDYYATLIEQYRNRFAQTKADQEMERVFIAMMFGTSNPIGAIASLRNLLGSLENPFAISLCSGAIKGIGQFAAERAIIDAKERGHNHFAQALSSVLQGIVIQSCNDCHNELVAGHPAEGVEHIANPLPEMQEVEVVKLHTDINTGEITEEVVSVFYAPPDNCDDSHCSAVDSAVNAFTDAAGMARSTEADAYKFANATKTLTEQTLTATARLDDLKYQADAITDPGQLAKNMDEQIALKKDISPRSLGTA